MRLTFQKFASTLWFILPALVALLTLYVRVRLLDVPLERDEGEYAYLGQLLLKGVPPFATVYSMKLPGISGAYALIMGLFGQTARGIHVGLLLVNLASIALMYLLGKRIADERTGAVAASVFALMAVSQSVFGVFAHATHFVVLFSLAGFLLLFPAIDRRKFSLAILSGLMFGVSFTMKQHAAPIIAFAFAWLLYQSIKGKTGRRYTIFSSLLFCIGVAIPYIIWCLYLYEKGVFEKFWFWTVTYAAEYAAGQGTSDLKIFANKVLYANWPLWLLAGAGLFCLLRKEIDNNRVLFLVGLLLSSIAAVMPGYYFRSHYFVLMLPAAALLAATAITTLFTAAGVVPSLKRLAVVIIVASFALTFYSERKYFFYFSPREVSRSIYKANPFIESPAIAAYLKARTLPTDRIAVLGSEPQIFFHADRQSATSHIYMYGLMEEQPYAGRMQEEAILEIETAKPGYIVLVNVSTSWLLRFRSVQRIFSWYERYLNDYYDIDGVIDIVDPNFTEMRWGADARNYTPKALNNILIFRRKG